MNSNDHQNEIDAAKSVHFDYLNAQGQVKLVWPKTYSLARAYLDQLERSKAMATGRIAEFRDALDRAEKAPDAEQRKALTELATQVEREAGRAGDPAKAQLLAGVVSQLATSTSLASRR